MKTKTSSTELLPQVILSLATLPLLVFLSLAQTLAQILTEMGQGSEEIFRGDRLPILHLRKVKDQNHN